MKSSNKNSQQTEEQVKKLLNTGLQYFQSGDLENAYDTYEKAYLINKNIFALTMMCNSVYDKKSVEKAVPYLAESMQIEGNGPLCCCLIGSMCILGNVPEYAITYLEEALKLGLDKSTVRYQLGSAYFKTEKYDCAIENLTKASADPKLYALALLIRGKAYLKIGQKKKANADFKKCADLPQEHNTCVESAEAFYRLGKNKECMERLAYAVEYAEHRTNKKNIYWDSAALYAKMGEKELAEKYLKLALENKFDPALRFASPDKDEYNELEALPIFSKLVVDEPEGEYDEENEKKIIDSGECGDDITWKLDSEGTLTISGEGEMMDFGNYDEYGDPCCYEYKPAEDVDAEIDITSLIIEEGITCIGSMAFNDYYNIESVKLPQSLQYIGEGAFDGCFNIEKINIPDSVGHIGVGAFKNCTSLSEVRIGNSVQLINIGAFYNCSLLESIQMSDSVSWIESQAFEKCSNLKYITLPETLQVIETCTFKESGIERIEIPETVSIISKGAFCGCQNLRTLSIPDSVTSIEEMAFLECKSLKTVILPNTISKIEEQTFNGCTSLSEIVIPNSVTSIAQKAFYGCKKLESITIPTSVKSIGVSAFAKCSSLKSLYIAKKKPLKLKGKEFDGSQAKCILYVPIGTKELYASEPVWKDFKDIKEYTPAKEEKPDKLIVAKGKCGKNVRWVLRSGLLSLYGTGDTYDFHLYRGYETSAPWKWYTKEIVGVQIEEGVKYIGDYAFANCENLVMIGGWKEDVLISKCALEGCPKLINEYE